MSADAIPRESRSTSLVREAFVRGYRVVDGRVRGPSGRVLALRLDKAGYDRFGMKVDGRTVNVMTHRLAAFQRFGESMVADGIEVRHLDGNAHNNREDNLLLGSHLENMRDRDPLARLDHAVRTARVRRRLTDDEALALRADRKAGMEYRRLATKYSVSLGTAHYVVNSRSSIMKSTYPIE